MNNISFNTIAMCALSTALAIFGLGIVGQTIFHVDQPEKPGMIVEVVEAETEPADTAAEEEISVVALLASADVAKGEKEFAKCKGCHTPEEGGANRIGPNLWNIVGRKIAVADGFGYSNALQAKNAEDWTFEALDGFIKRPRDWAPGTSMGFGGLKSPEKRANLIAYLRSLANDPVPVPSE